MPLKRSIALLVISLVVVAPALAQTPRLHSDAKMFVAPMAGGFDDYLKAALKRKDVPVQVVENREQAEFEIKGSAESQKASTAKKVFLGSWHSDEQASISVVDLKSGEVVTGIRLTRRIPHMANRVRPKLVPNI